MKQLVDKFSLYRISLNEKFAIIDDPDKNLLNKRSKVIS